MIFKNGLQRVNFARLHCKRSAREIFHTFFEMQPPEDDPPVRDHRYLTRLERQQVAAQLLEEVNMATGEPILAHGAIARCAKNFGVSRPAISKLWKHMKRNFADGILTISPVKKKPHPLLYCRDELMARICDIPYHRRRTLRDMAADLGVGKTTLFRILREEKDDNGDPFMVPHTNSVLPELTEEHKVARVLYALGKLDFDRGCFSSFLQDVHVDEKWFELTPKTFRYYVTQDEKENNEMPIRRVAHKSHIPKIMFLAATARPRYDNNGNCTFDGKIGIWPIVKRKRAIRNSVNRPAGTMITEPVSVTQRIYRQLLLEKVIPAIKNRFPHNRDRTVFIQQDGASAHITSPEDPFYEALDEIRGKFGLFWLFFKQLY